MSKSRNGRRENGDRGNGYHENLTDQVLERDYDIEAEEPAPLEMFEPLSPEDLCDEVRRALRAEGIVEKVSYETDKAGRSGVVIWNVNRAQELKVTTALAEHMTFQVGAYVEREADGSDGKELGMVIFIFSIKGHGTVR